MVCDEDLDEEDEESCCHNGECDCGCDLNGSEPCGHSNCEYCPSGGCVDEDDLDGDDGEDDFDFDNDEFAGDRDKDDLDDEEDE